MYYIMFICRVKEKKMENPDPEGSLSFGKVYNTDFYSV